VGEIVVYYFSGFYHTNLIEHIFQVKYQYCSCWCCFLCCRSFDVSGGVALYGVCDGIHAG